MPSLRADLIARRPRPPINQSTDRPKPRDPRRQPPQADFRKAKEKVLYKKKEGVPEGLYM